MLFHYDCKIIFNITGDLIQILHFISFPVARFIVA